MLQITAHQKKTIWALWKKEIGQPDSTLYAMIMAQFGCEHMSAMSRRQAELLIRGLRRLALRLGPDRLTAAQHGEIHRRRRALGWPEATMDRFCEKVTGVGMIAWLTVAQARCLITALEKLRREGYGARKEESGGVQREG